MEVVVKKTIFFVIILAALTFAGCKTVPQVTQPVFPVGIEYRVLGRVTLEKPRLKNGYLELLKKAKEEYPDSDDVVNILVDFAWNGRHYVLSGLVIKYIQ